MNRQISPVQAAVAIVLVLIVIGGVWWFVKGRGPASPSPQAVQQMLQQEQYHQSPVPGGAARR